MTTKTRELILTSLSGLKLTFSVSAIKEFMEMDSFTGRKELFETCKISVKINDKYFHVYSDYQLRKCDPLRDAEFIAKGCFGAFYCSKNVFLDEPNFNAVQGAITLCIADCLTPDVIDFLENKKKKEEQQAVEDAKYRAHEKRMKFALTLNGKTY